jgi:predicted RNase H-like HicB family nuclease
MLIEYFKEALERANYEIIEDQEPYYGEIAETPGVWSTGKTLEECRRNLALALEDWLLFSIAKGLPVPPIGGIEIKPPESIAS